MLMCTVCQVRLHRLRSRGVIYPVDFIEADVSWKREERCRRPGSEKCAQVQSYEQKVLPHFSLTPNSSTILTIRPTSFFGDQEGDFSLDIKAIKAVRQSLDLEGGIQNVRISTKL
jgi:hypothetical protein